MAPTAEEFLRKNIDYVLEKDCKEDVENAMIEFAKLHVEAALKAASEKARLLVDGKLTYFSRYIVDEGNHDSETEIDVSTDSILNSYPISNII